MNHRPAPLIILTTLLLLRIDATAQQAHVNGLELSVVDLTTGQLIQEFRVVAGVRAGAIMSQEFIRRGGGEVVNWQPHTTRIGKGGNYIFPLDRAYDELALRVEADGYQPQRKMWIKKADGPKHLVFQLEPDPGIDVLVLQPDGKPAAGASIATVLPQRDARIENGRIQGDGASLPEKPGDRWRRPVIVHSDANGRARVATETDPASAVLVVHDSGVREVSFDQFRQLKQVQLRGWGRIEGRILWHDKPGAKERVSLSVFRDDYGYPGMIESYADTDSDAEGRFVFEQVLPGHTQISRPIRLPEKGEMGIQDAIFDGLVFHINVESDKPTAVLVGGRGRKVSGRLVGRQAWDGVTMHFHPNAPHIGMPGDNTMWQAFDLFRKSPIGPLFFRNDLKPSPTAAFEFANVLPGHYQLFISAPDGKGHIGGTTFTVKPESPDAAPEAMDLGAIEVKPVALPDHGADREHT